MLHQLITADLEQQLFLKRERQRARRPGPLSSVRTEDGETPRLVTNQSLDVTGRGSPRRAGPLTHTMSPCAEALLLIRVSTVTGKQTHVDPPASCSDVPLTLSVAALPPLSGLQGGQLAQGVSPKEAQPTPGFPVWAQGWHYGS